MNDKMLHYRIKYQDSNVAILEFSKHDVADFLKDSLVWIEDDSGDPSCFWENFETALLEISGVYFAFIDGYDILIIKDCRFQNWGKLLEDVIWCSLFFINPGGKAVETLKNGKKFGKIISHSFRETEPESKSKSK